MRYDIHCHDCDTYYEINQRFEDPIPKCPNCESGNVKRVFSVPRVAVVKGDDEIKIGHLADRNRDRFSSDQKEYLDVKHKRPHRKVEEPWWQQYNTKSTKEIMKMTPKEQKEYIGGDDE